MKRHTPFFPLLLSLLILQGNLFAQQRSMQEIETRARTYFLKQASENSLSQRSLSEKGIPALIGSSSSLLAGVKKESFYIFEEEGKGFVILSADQRMPEILGYSHESSLQPTHLPDGLRTLLASYQIWSEQVEKRTTGIQEESNVPDLALPKEKKPLLHEISWTQEYPYNNNCPEIGGTHTLLGCVATAMSTIMAYYKYPEQGKGTSSYTWNGKTLKGDFSSHSYRWDRIRPTYPYINYADSVENLFSPEESQEVAKLCYDVALSIQTSFGTQTSNSLYTVQRGLHAFVNHFSYDPNVQVLYRNYFSRAEWLSILQKEIAENRPVFYRGGETALSGHVFIADGYDKDGYIHFDFGWGGVANGYYHIAAISPDDWGAGATGGNGFNIDQFIFVGLQPPTEDSHYQSHLILNKELVASGTELRRQENFSLRSTLLNKGTAFNGTYCAVLSDEGGNTYEVSPPTSIHLNMDASWNFNLEECQIPDTLPPGLYRLRILAKDHEEKEWNIVRSLSSVPGYYKVWISNDSVKLTHASTENTLREGSATAAHTLYAGLSGHFTLTLSNGESEFLGTIGIGALKDSSSYTVLAHCIGSVQSEETISYSLSGTINLDPGEYTLVPIYKENGKWHFLNTEGTQVVVKENPGGSENLTCLQTEFLQNGSKVARSGMLEGSISFKNTGAPYSEGLVFAFFHDVPGNSYNISTHFIPFFLDTDGATTQLFCFPHNLPEGNYYVSLYKFDSNGSLQRVTPKENTSFRFTVIKDSVLSGLPLALSDKKALTIEYAEGEVIIRSPQPLTRIQLFSSNGMCLRSKNRSEEENEWRIPTQGLREGIYLLRTQLITGDWESIKFRVR